MTFTIAEQLDAIEREIRFREFVYPRRVRDGKMTQAEADRQIARGAGTISAKADVAQLANLRRYKEAAQMVEDHRRQCGEQLYPQNVVDCWKATEYSA